MSARPTSTLRAALAIAAADLVLAVCIWRFGPPRPIPAHVGFAGVVDRYGDRNETAGVLVGMVAISALCWLVLEVMRRRSDRPRAFAAAQMVMLVVLAFVGFLKAVQTFGGSLGLHPASPRFHMAALSLLFAGVGAFSGRVPQNPLVGVRTYWSRTSRLAWEKSNRLCGRLLFWIGVVGFVAAPFAPEPQGFQAVILSVLFAAAASTFESWRVWRADPERTRL